MAVIFIASPKSLPVGLTRVGANWESIFSAVADVPTNEDVVLIARNGVDEKLARGVRLALNTERIGIYTTTVPPTLFFTFAATLALLPANNLGLIGAIERYVVQRSYTQVLMSSVSRLERPNPTLIDHVGSLIPGTRYLVDWTRQQITRAKNLAPIEAPLHVLARSEHQWPEDKLLPLPPHAISLPVMAQAWESRRWIELSAVFSPPEEVVRTVTAHHQPGQSPTCVGCGRIGSGHRCIFCAVPIAQLELSVSSVPQTHLDGGNL